MKGKKLIALCAVVGVTVIIVAVALSRPSLLESILEPPPAPFDKAVEPDDLLRQYFGYIAGGQYEDTFQIALLRI